MAHTSDTNGDMPSWMKWTMTFINRMGFPIFAFIAVAYIAYIQNEKFVCALNKNTDVMRDFIAHTKTFQEIVAKDHFSMMNNDCKIIDNQDSIIDELRRIEYHGKAAN